MKQDIIFSAKKEIRSELLTLKKLICNKYGSETACAKSIGWTKQRLNKITTGKHEPTVGEVNIIANTLDVQVPVILEIFLYP